MIVEHDFVKSDEIDFFISHASEDKEDIARNLSLELMRFGARVYYDEFSLKVGDSISQSINKGLATANHAIIVISRNFLNKKWTMAEMNAIVNMHVTDQKKIIPILHGISVEELRKQYPMIADIKGIKSELGYVECAKLALSAIDKPIRIGWMESSVDDNEGHFQHGFHLMLSIAFANFNKLRHSECIMQLAGENKESNILSIYRNDARKLGFQIVDGKERAISTVLGMASWKDGQNHIVILDFLKTGKLELYLDSKLVENIDVSGYDFSKFMVGNSQYIVGCSFNHENEASFKLSGLSLGSYLGKEHAVKYTKEIIKLLIACNKDGFGHLSEYL